MRASETAAGPKQEKSHAASLENDFVKRACSIWSHATSCRQDWIVGLLQLSVADATRTRRWDIETKSGLLIKLPKDNIDKALELVLEILRKDPTNELNKIDLRQQNQIIINE